jgi:hypothetical protein
MLSEHFSISGTWAAFAAAVLLVAIGFLHLRRIWKCPAARMRSERRHRNEGLGEASPAEGSTIPDKCGIIGGLGSKHPAEGVSVPAVTANPARTYRRQGTHPKPGREVPSIRAAVARTALPAILEAPTSEVGASHILSPIPGADGRLYANPQAFMLTQTVEAPDSRLWFRDVYQAYQKHAKNIGLHAASSEMFSRAASNLGWRRSKANTRYFCDRALRLEATPLTPTRNAASSE